MTPINQIRKIVAIICQELNINYQLIWTSLYPTLERNQHKLPTILAKIKETLNNEETR